VAESAAPASSSTVPDVADHATERRAQLLRRLALGAFAVLVLLGLTGLLGVRARTVTADGTDGTRVELTYPLIARPALAIPFHLRIARAAGFDEQIEVRISRSWLDAFDENGVNPEPAEATTDGDDIVWTFDPPRGQVFVLSLDTRVEPGVQWKREGTTTVTIGSERIDVGHTMWVFP
jgi:hypothetical protein